MTSPFHDDLYYVVEQIILIAVAFILLVLILLQLRAEQLQGAKVPISKYRIHRILLICFTLQAIRCIDPRGRYSILPLPLLGFVVVNQIPAVALCGSTFLASSVAALEQTSSTPVPRLLRILPIAAPIVTTSVFNILSILRFSLPLEWLEGVCYIYFAVFMVFGGASSIQFSAGRLQRVITTHIAAVDAANGETAASSVTDHQQEEMRKNYSALMLIRVVTGLQAVFIIAVVLLAGIQIVHKGAVHASSDTYEPIGQYLGEHPCFV